MKKGVKKPVKKGVKEEDEEGYWKELNESWYGRAESVEKPEKKTQTNDTTRAVSSMVESLTHEVAELKQQVADANWKLDKLLLLDSPWPPRLEPSARVPPTTINR